MRGFSLIEVLIAVMILSISATIFFEITSNSKHLLKTYIKNKEKLLKNSILIEDTNATNAYELLLAFKIDNDKIIRVLKNFKIHKKIIKEGNMTIIYFNNTKYYGLF